MTKPTTHTPGPWRYEPGTKTVRAEPSNYWLATMDSWDGAVNNEANARLIAAAPALLAALSDILDLAESEAETLTELGRDDADTKDAADAAWDRIRVARNVIAAATTAV